MNELRVEKNKITFWYNGLYVHRIAIPRSAAGNEVVWRRDKDGKEGDVIDGKASEFWENLFQNTIRNGGGL